MDAVLKFVVDEVALEGDKGCSLDRLWTLLEDRHARALLEEGDASRAPIRFDDALKGFYWPFVAKLPQLSAQLARQGRGAKKDTANADQNAAGGSKPTRKGAAPKPKKKKPRRRGDSDDEDIIETPSEESEEESEAELTDEDSDDSTVKKKKKPTQKKPAKGKAPAKAGTKRKAPASSDDFDEDEDEDEADGAGKSGKAGSKKGKKASQDVETQAEAAEETSESPAKKRGGRPSKKQALEPAKDSAADAPMDLAGAPEPESQSAPAPKPEPAPEPGPEPMVVEPAEPAGESEAQTAPQPEQQEGAAEGSPAPETKDEIDVKPVLSELAEMTLARVRDLFGDRLRLVADAESRWQAITRNVDTTVNLPPVSAQILSAVAASRNRGMTQVELCRQFNIDPRSIFHHVKAIQATKLVVKFPVISKGQYTNVLVHAAFAPFNEDYQTFLRTVPTGVSADVDLGGMKGMRMHSDSVKKKITEMLKARKNGIMVVEDMHAELGFVNIDKKQRKWFNKVVDGLSKSGHVEKAELVLEDRERGARKKCIKFVKDFIPELELDAAAKAAIKAEQSVPKGKRIAEGGVLADLPLDYQVYRLIGVAGEEGTTSTDIRKTLHNLQNRVLVRAIEYVTKPDKGTSKTAAGATKEVESVGRERRYRYHADQAWQDQMAKFQTEDVDAPPRLNGVRETDEVKPQATIAQPTKALPPAVEALRGAQSAGPVRSPSPAPSQGPRSLAISASERLERMERLLERHRILELWVPTIKLYQDFENEELGTANPYRLDKKTVERMVAALEAKNKVRKIIFSAPLVSGSYVQKTIVVVPELDKNSREVKDFMEDVRNKVLLPDPAKYRPVERVRLERGTVVERSDGEHLVAQTQGGEEGDAMDVDQNLGAKVSTGQGPSFMLAVLDRQLEVPAVRRPVAPRIRVKKEDAAESWQEIGIDYGYLPGKMVRARLLHQFLLKHMQTRQDEDVPMAETQQESEYSGNGVFPTSVFLTEFTLDTYLRLIGLTTRSDIIDRFLAGGGASTRMRDLPKDASAAILGGQRIDKYRRQLRLLVDVLLSLGILQTVENSERQSFATTAKSHLDLSYRLARTVELRDYNSPGQDVVATHVFDTPAAINAFWKQLYAVSTAPSRKVLETENLGSDGVNMASTEPNSEDEDEEGGEEEAKPKKTGRKRKAAPNDFAEDHPLFGIHDNKTWNETPLKPATRRRLNEYIETKRKKSKTPLGNEELLQRISQEVGMRIERVRDYYRYVQSIYDEDGEAIVRVPRLPKHKRKGENESAVASEDETDAEPAGQGTPGPRKRGRPPKSGAAAVPTPTEEEEVKEKPPKVRKPPKPKNPLGKHAPRQRILWTDQEDDILMHAFVIASWLNGSESRVSWSSIASQLRSAITGPACKRRIAVLRKQQVKDLQIQSWTIGWPAMFDRAVEAGILDPQDDVVNHQKDLGPWTQYFREHSREIPMYDPKMSDLVFLPEDLAFVDHLMDVTPVSNASDVLRAVEELAASRSTLRVKLTALYNAPYVADVKQEATREFQEEDIGDAEEQLIRAKIKMVIWTPEERYSTNRAFQLLGAHNEEKIQLAIDDLKHEGTIVKLRSGEAGHDAQHRGYKMSHKFWSNLASAGSPPNFVANAASYATALDRTGIARFDPHSQDGVVACILEHAASREAILSVPRMDTQLLSASIKDLTNLEISIRLMRDAKQPVGEPPVLAGPVAVPPLTEESAKRDPAVATVSRIRGISAAQVLQAKTVYNKIASAGREGVTLRTLEDQLPEINVGEALAALLRTKLPGEDGLPVVARVGFESVIYVTHAHFAEWNVDITTEEDLADNKRHLVPPRLWYDIEGGVVDKVLRMCRDAVTSMVVSRPGISFAKLCQHLSASMTPPEIADVVADKRLIVSRPLKSLVNHSNLWDKNVVFYEERDQENAEPDGMASLFPGSGWYTSLAAA